MHLYELTHPDGTTTLEVRYEFGEGTTTTVHVVRQVSAQMVKLAMGVPSWTEESPGVRRAAVGHGVVELRVPVRNLRIHRVDGRPVYAEWIHDYQHRQCHKIEFDGLDLERDFRVIEKPSPVSGEFGLPMWREYDGYIDVSAGGTVEDRMEILRSRAGVRVTRSAPA